MKITQEYVYTNSVPKVLKSMRWCPHISQVIRVTWYSNIGTAERMAYKIYIWLTFDQCRQLGHWLSISIKNSHVVYSPPFQYIVPPYLRFCIHYSLCCKLVFTVEKHLHMSGPTQFKPVLFKSQQHTLFFLTEVTSKACRRIKRTICNNTIE